WSACDRTGSWKIVLRRVRHLRESGGPEQAAGRLPWIPAFAGNDKVRAVGPRDRCLGGRQREGSESEEGGGAGQGADRPLRAALRAAGLLREDVVQAGALDR